MIMSRVDEQWEHEWVRKKEREKKMSEWKACSTPSTSCWLCCYVFSISLALPRDFATLRLFRDIIWRWEQRKRTCHKSLFSVHTFHVASFEWDEMNNTTNTTFQEDEGGRGGGRVVNVEKYYWRTEEWNWIRHLSYFSSKNKNIQNCCLNLTWHVETEKINWICD